MLPTKKFNQLPITTEVDDSTLVFCIFSGSDSLVSLGTLRNYFGVISGSGTGIGPTGNPSTGIYIYIASSYVELLTLEAGSEYYVEPYIYKRVGTGVLRINPDTEYSTPLTTGISGGLVLPTYAQMLLSEDGYEYHESPYVYKKYSGGACRINCDTDFTVPSGTGTTTGIVFDTYANLLASSMYGYEYHESPFVYKRTSSGILKINCDTDFVIPS